MLTWEEFVEYLKRDLMYLEGGSEAYNNTQMVGRIKSIRTNLNKVEKYFEANESLESNHDTQTSN